MRVNLMIEGQEDVSWEQWVAIGGACDEAGLDGLYRSDHYGSVQGRPDRGSLDAWTTLAGVAAVTERVRLGTMVSPVTFRHPSVVAKSAATVDHISGGRVELGLGAGWNREEHSGYGFEFPPTGARLEMLAEQLEIVHRQWTEEDFTFEGRHYRLEHSEARPKPVQRPHPPLIVGGSAGARSLALAARWADEYNTVGAPADECARRKQRLDVACEARGRDPSSIRFSLMTGILGGPSESAVLDRARRLMERDKETGDARAWMQSREREWVLGTTDRVLERLGQLERAGVQGVMLQNLLHDDTDLISWLGAEVRPHVPG